MFFEYRSESLPELAKSLSRTLLESRGKDPFSPHWVVVQNNESRQWLTLQIARNNGITSNIEFVLPSEFMWKLYRLGDEKLPKNLPSDRNSVHWQLFGFFEQGMEIMGIPGQIMQSQKGRFHLAGQIADVFDLYQMYRPDLLDGWEQNRLSTKHPAEKWQAYLWRELRKTWSKEHPELPARNKALGMLREAAPDYLPESIYVFALSQFSGPFADLITSISRDTDIHFFGRGMEIPTGFSSVDQALRDWSAPHRQSAELLHAFILQKKTESESLHPGGETPGFFSTLQRRAEMHPIEIHSCHNVEREARVLKDALLNKFDHTKALKPEDVLIIVPDMETYGPVIESVFEAEEGAPRIPVSIPGIRKNTEVRLLGSLLELLTGSFRVNDFMDFIGHEAITSRMDMSMEEMSQLRKWLIENKVHWGLDTSESKYSLGKGVKALMAGFAMEAGEFDAFRDVIPAEGVNTTAHSELGAKYSFLYRMLRSFRIEVQGEKNVLGWLKVFEGWVIRLQHTGNNSTGSFTGILALIQRLHESCAYSKTGPEIPFLLFKDWISSQMKEVQAASNGLGHGVVLSSYIPYRGIPFKYVAVLGFNEGTFPRNPVRPDFDLINSYPQPGDRITKEDDELLFAELLQSTSGGIHFSYLGQDQHTGDQRLPSILLQELMDVLEGEGHGCEVTAHRLHAFDPEYFETPTSYSAAQKKLAEKVLSENKLSQIYLDHTLGSGKIEKGAEIPIHDLIHFFSHPCKYFAANTLLVNNGYSEFELEDRETFRLSGLQGYEIDQLIHQGIATEKQAGQLWEFASKKGLVPEGLPGKIGFEARFSDVSELSSKAAYFKEEEERTHEFEVQSGDYRLTGNIGQLYGNRRVIFRIGRLRARDLLSVWISHLALQAAGAGVQESLIITKEKKYGKTKIVISGFQEVTTPEKYLGQLVNWFAAHTSDNSLLAFFPESSKAFYEAEANHKDPIKSAYNEWLGSDYSFSAEGADYYNALVWRGSDPILQPVFKRNAGLFWAPILSYVEQKK